jgi:hypothetical protein
MIVPALLLVSDHANGQTFTKEKVTTISPEGGVINWLIMAGFLLGCLLVAFLPAKRSNLK